MIQLIKVLLPYFTILFFFSCQQKQGSSSMITIDSLEYEQLIEENESLLKANTNLQAEINRNNKKLDSLVTILPALETITEFKQPFSAFYLYPEKQNEISIGIKGSITDSTESFEDFKYARLSRNIEIDLYSDSYYNSSYKPSAGQTLLKNAGYQLFYGRLDDAYKYSARNRTLNFVDFKNYYDCTQIISVWEERNREIRFKGIVDVGFCGGEVGGYNKIDTMYHFRNRGVSGHFSDATIIEMSLGSGDEGYTWSSKRIGILYSSLKLEIVYEESIHGRYEGVEEGFLEERLETDMDFENDILIVTKIDRKKDGTESILKTDSINIKEIVTSKIGGKRWENF